MCGGGERSATLVVSGRRTNTHRWRGTSGPGGGGGGGASEKGAFKWGSGEGEVLRIWQINTEHFGSYERKLSYCICHTCTVLYMSAFNICHAKALLLLMTTFSACHMLALMTAFSACHMCCKCWWLSSLPFHIHTVICWWLLLQYPAKRNVTDEECLQYIATCTARPKVSPQYLQHVITGVSNIYSTSIYC